MTPVPTPRLSKYTTTYDLNGTWIECESYAYETGQGAFTRRAYVELQRNQHNPILLPYGERRIVLCSIADTFYSVPARLKHRGRTVKGFISVAIGNDAIGRLTFTPLSKASTHITDAPCTCDACQARKKKKK